MPNKISVKKRIQILKNLLVEIEKNEQNITDALYSDFNKSEAEIFLTEIFFVKSELKKTIKKLPFWLKPKRVVSSLLNFPSSDFIYKQPYGKVLIIAPWNYPFQLSFCPMIAAFAAGNSIVLKPSEWVPNTNSVILKIIEKVFEKKYVSVELGGVEKATELLSKRWDYIFFTGSVAVGKIVHQAASKHLTPVTLELGGKNPCIVDETAQIDLSAKRIVWGKFINAGQTCIAPDYVLVHEKVKEKFIEALIKYIKLFYGDKVIDSLDYPRIISENHTNRLVKLLEHQQIVFGGEFSIQQKFLEPTIVLEPSFDSPLMREEIFGPILPIIGYTLYRDLETIISRYEKPLALYYFTTNKTNYSKVIKDFSFGGGVINDTLVHFANSKLPFGGVGQSGLGAYHGVYSIDTFTHKKSVVRRSLRLDVSLRYPPFVLKLKKVRKILNFLSKF